MKLTQFIRRNYLCLSICLGIMLFTFSACDLLFTPKQSQPQTVKAELGDSITQDMPDSLVTLSDSTVRGSTDMLVPDSTTRVGDKKMVKALQAPQQLAYKEPSKPKSTPKAKPIPQPKPAPKPASKPKPIEKPSSVSKPSVPSIQRPKNPAIAQPKPALQPKPKPKPAYQTFAEPSTKNEVRIPPNKRPAPQHTTEPAIVRQPKPAPKITDINTTKPTLSDFHEGQIYVKVKNGSSQSLTFEGNTNNTNRHPLATIIQQYQITKIGKPFTRLNIMSNVYKAEFAQHQRVDQLISDLQRLDFVEYAEKIPIQQISR